MAITFHQKGPEENGVTPYEVILDKSYTVREFIKDILQERTFDKGVFYIPNPKEGFPIIEYAYGHTRYGFVIPDRFGCLNVKSVTVKVRWSQIDYYIETGDADERES